MTPIFSWERMHWYQFLVYLIYLQLLFCRFLKPPLDKSLEDRTSAGYWNLVRNITVQQCEKIIDCGAITF